ncbi:MAG TPA: hypothetical protein VGB24_00500 [Longimicrobium sp.]|jgi:hypothetical protein|uniref:HD domain-containing protein n=1 Tax=Longimicrobium sp. TaxID=2029185 RepID=UPI002ED80BDF
MRLPKRLSSRLSIDKGLEAKVYATIEEFEPWISSGGQRPTFFPDYTDHSIRHIEEVLETGSDLIRAEAWKSFTPADAAILVVAALLHDSALHLTKEGFEALVRPGSRWLPLQGFSDKPWSELWAGFCSEAQRFSPQQLSTIFGDSQPAPIPDLDDLILDGRTRRLIGEFLRRHHPRLAHEIARIGVPGPTGTFLSVRLSADHAEIAGLVARSHGHPVREMLPYLKGLYHNRVAPLGIHAVFLMVILRVADYLQIQASRAPAILANVHRIRSPYSATEWNVHASVRDIRESEDDPETIFVHAVPGDVKTFLRLKDWLASLQQELDQSWAVLGEVFSRQSVAVQKLGIKLRRIRSNIDDVPSLAELVPFVPKRVNFSIASPSVLSLLIRPLYGERPEIGIRELIQNAVDSVRELANLKERGLVPLGIEYSAIESDVELSIEQVGDEIFLTVSDRGTGMTPEIVTDYFLRAGVSFRSSSAWREAFVDVSGQSLVMRSGRFGVGALAAFLLGDEIEVSTRHYSVPANRGIKFRAGLHTDPVELCWCERPVGTSITVTLSSQAAQQLFTGQNGRYRYTPADQWDWYCLDSPKVIRRIEPDGRTLRQRHIVPAPGEVASGDWRHIHVPRFSDVYWTFGNTAPALTSNGIIIHEEVSPFGDRSTHSRGYFNRERDILLSDTSPYAFRAPAVAIYDPDGFLPLDLRRETLTHVPGDLSTALLEDVSLDYLGHSARCAPTFPFFETGNCSWCMGMDYPGSCAPRARVRPFWCWTPQGYVLNEASTLWEADVERIVFYPVLIESKSARAGGAELWEGNNVVVVPVPMILDEYAEGPDEEDDEETRFGTLTYRRAYAAFIRRTTTDLIVSLSHRAGGEPSTSNILLQAYEVRGLIVYSDSEARSELDDYLLKSDIEGHVAHFSQYEFASRYVISIGSLEHGADDPGPSFTFLGRTRPFPIVEVSVRRRSDCPHRAVLHQQWAGISRTLYLSRDASTSVSPSDEYPRVASYIRAQEESKIYNRDAHDQR